MSFAIDTQCLLCHLRRNLETVKPLGTEEQAMAFAKDLMRLYLEAPEGVASPWFNPHTSDLMLKHYGLPIDRMKEEKELSNRFVMERMDLIRQKAEAAPDPVYAGLQFAVLGNYLDFAALQGQVSFEKLEEMLDKAFDMDLDRVKYSANLFISTAVRTLASRPCCSRASATAMAFITVASMPIASAWLRCSLPEPFLTPRQKLPPPMTRPTWTPISTHSLMEAQTALILSKSRPKPSPAAVFSPRASPLTFSRMRLYLISDTKKHTPSLILIISFPILI